MLHAIRTPRAMTPSWLARLTLSLFLASAGHVHSADEDGPITLVHSQVKPGPGEPDFYSQLNKIFGMLFAGSEIQSTPRLVPPGTRSLADMVNGNIDIALIALNPRAMIDFPYELIDIHEPALTLLQRRYYALKSKHIPANANTQLSQYHLGMTKLPKKVAEALLEQKLGSIFFYQSHLKLVKALASRRIDIMISGQQIAQRAFNTLGIEDQVEDLGQAYSTELHLVIRASLPKEKKQALLRVLERRIPELHQQGAFEALFSEVLTD